MSELSSPPLSDSEITLVGALDSTSSSIDAGMLVSGFGGSSSLAHSSAVFCAAQNLKSS